MALASSFLDRPVPADTLIFGEVGLTGEVRAVSAPNCASRKATNWVQTRPPGPPPTEHLGEFPGLELLGVDTLATAMTSAGGGEVFEVFKGMTGVKEWKH